MAAKVHFFIAAFVCTAIQKPLKNGLKTNIDT
jgi:hypothetical protein